jgi:hypothetical protein
MPEISIQDAVSCLSTISHGQISATSHAVERMEERFNEKWIYQCLIKNQIVGILKQNPQKFKLYYKHPQNGYKHDLVIVVVFGKYPKCDIRIVTIYEQSIKRRVREDV